MNMKRPKSIASTCMSTDASYGIVFLFVHSLLRTAILSDSVMRGDANNIPKVQQMFSDWSKHNTRFVGVFIYR